MKKCINCGNSIDKQHNYCSNCGQNTSVNEITYKEFFNNLISVFDLEKSFFSTFIKLVLKPDIVVKEYLQGKRINYFSPLKLFFVVYSFFSLFAIIIDKENPNAIKILIENLLFFLILSLIYYGFARFKIKYIESIIYSLYTGSIIFFIVRSFSISMDIISDSIDDTLFLILIISHIIAMIAYLTFVYKKLFNFKFFISVLASIFTLTALFFLLQTSNLIL